MKANLRKLILGLFFIGIAITISVSCKKTAESLTTTCSNITNLCQGKTVKYCVDLVGSGYYEYNNIKYSFTITTITTAASQVTTAMGCK
jgi:hypothetical protein